MLAVLLKSLLKLLPIPMHNISVSEKYPQPTASPGDLLEIQVPGTSPGLPESETLARDPATCALTNPTGDSPAGAYMRTAI